MYVLIKSNKLYMYNLLDFTKIKLYFTHIINQPCKLLIIIKNSFDFVLKKYIASSFGKIAFIIYLLLDLNQQLKKINPKFTAYTRFRQKGKKLKKKIK